MKIATSLYNALDGRDVFDALLELPGPNFREVNNRVTKRVTLNEQDYFLKFHQGIGWREVVKNLLHGQLPIVSAYNEKKILNLLKEKNILVPSVLGYAEKGINPARRKSFVLLEAMEPSNSLEELITQEEKISFIQKRHLIRRVAQIVRTIHQCGIFHRDMYLCHFLLLPSDLSSPKLAIIDFHRAQVYKKLPVRVRRKDLASLYFSAMNADLTLHDICRFLKIYFNCGLREIFGELGDFLNSVKVRAGGLYRKYYGEKIIYSEPVPLLWRGLFFPTRHTNLYINGVHVGSCSASCLTRSSKRAPAATAQNGDVKDFILQFLGIHQLAMTADVKGREQLQITEVLRINPNKRVVVRGVWGDKKVVAKIYLHPLKRFLHAQREESGVNKLVAANILTPKLLANVQALSQPWTVLIYEEITSLLDVNEKLNVLRDEKLFFQFIDVLIQHHEAGIFQKDLHINNFLITSVSRHCEPAQRARQSSMDGEHWIGELLRENKIYTLDGDQIVKTSGTLSLKQSFENLALFLAQFTWLSKAQQKIFIQYYLEKRGISEFEKNYLVILNEIEKHIILRGKKFLEKIYRNCTQFSVAKTYKKYHAVVREYTTPAIQQALGDLESVMKKPQVQVLKNGNTCTVVKIEIGGKKLVLKRYNIKNWRHFLLRMFRPTRAWHSWYGAHLYHYFSIPTLTPVALVEKRWGRLRKNAYFLSEMLEGELLRNYFLNPNYTDEQKKAVAKQALALLARLKELNIAHGDMKETNFVVKDGKLFIIDLDAVVWYSSKRRAERALMKDHKRFFRNWEGQPEILQFFFRLSPSLGLRDNTVIKREHKYDLVIFTPYTNNPF